jgi:2-keto-4-pentenoate hydratase/2-oxohepta-3-ene-1,7-dioic acid hydratase in catechol pathway
MKLVRYGKSRQEKPGIVDAEGGIRDLSAVIPDFTGEQLSPTALESLGKINVTKLPLAENVGAAPVRLGPCVGRVGKLVAIGLNYIDHAKEAGMKVPSEPVIFMKATSSISGPNDDVIVPRGSTKMDWEVELGVVIGTEAKYVSEDEAMKHIAGYCIVNDVSERAFQLEGTGQWVKGKSADTFAPLGPWLVTADEIPDPQNLKLWLEVDGKRCQDGTTRDMIFNVPQLVSYVSRFMSLQPGDTIATGTPPGVGLGRSPQVFLKAGNRMRLGVEGLGEQNQLVVGENA